MTWARIDDSFADHPKVIGLSDAAVAAWLRGLIYAKRYQTDGHLPQAAAKAFTRKPRAIQELVDVRLWEANGDGYVIHDYLDYNPSRAEVEAETERKREAGRIGAHIRWGTRDP